MTSVDPGLFYLYGQPLPGKTVEQLEDELLAHIERIQDKPVTERELEKALNGIEAAFVLAQDSLFYQGMLLGQYEMAGDWRKLDDYLPGVRAVTAEDIQRVATYYLSSDNRTIGVLDPLPVPPGHMVPLDSPAGMVH
jgi:zinc protease